MTETLTAPTATVPAADVDVDIINGSWCVVTLTTLNSRYTLLKRQALVVLTKDVATGPDTFVKKGDVIVGVGARVLNNGCLEVWDADDRMVFISSRITSSYVLEN